MKNLYEDIKTRLDELITSGVLQHVDLWNNQFERSNNDSQDQNTQQAFPYPCAFVHFFGENPRSSSGGGAKRLDVDVRIHVGIVSYEYTALEIFDIADSVRDHLENWNTSNMTGLFYVAQRFNYDHNNVLVYEIDFKTQYSDNTKYFKRNTVTVSAPIALELNADLDIDNNIIRTGNGS